MGSDWNSLGSVIFIITGIAMIISMIIRVKVYDISTSLLYS